MAALIGALRVSLSADTARFEQGMKRAQRQAQTSAGAINKSLGVIKAGVAGLVSGLSIGLLTNVIKGALDYAGSLGEVSQQLGVTTKELQTFRYAVSQNGGSVQDADQALGKFSVSISKAQAGSVQAQKAFKAVGVELADLQTKSKSEVLGQIADEMIRTGGASKNAAAGFAIFGRGFLKIVPTLDQGSAGMNELSAAAERLGIVLSAEQIAKADETADKLDALKTVLSAQIAGIVADNADAILGLANALADLVGSIGSALTAWANFRAQMNSGLLELQGMDAAAARARGSAFVSDKNPTVPGRSVTIGLGKARPAPAPRPTGNINQFLAPKGGGGGRKGGRDRSAEEAERKRLEALRDANRFDQEIRRAKIDVLQATRDLATDEIERYQISVDIKDLERSAYAAQLEYEVAAKERTKLQAEQLLFEYDRRDALERQKLIEEESQRAFEDSARVDLASLDLQREALQAEAQNAETAKEQRAIQLRILDLNYQIERARLETVLADKQSSEAAKEEARRRLNALPSMQKQDEKGVIAGTRGPLEDYMSQLPSTTEKWNEALENVAANGLRSVEDGIVDILTGAKTVGEALQDILGDIIKQLIRIAVQKLIVQTIGGGMGFATGGFVSGPGTATSDSIPAMLSNGEFVMSTGAVRNFGVPFFNAINTGQITPEMLAEKGGGGGGMGFLKFLSPAAFLASSAKKGGVGGFLKALSPLALLGGKIFGFSEGGLVGGGLPIPRVSYGPRVGISNDNQSLARGGDSYHFSFPGVTNAREGRQAGLQAANALRGAVARSSRVNS